MLEMASLGAKVLQIRSVELAKKYNVPLLVKSSLGEGKGTLVCKEDMIMMEKVVISGVTYNKNEVKITVNKVPDKPGMASKIFTALADAKCRCRYIVQNVTRELQRHYLHRGKSRCKEGLQDIGRDMQGYRRQQALPLMRILQRYRLSDPG